METPPEQSLPEKHLSLLLSIIETIENHIRETYFSYYKIPQWELTEGDFKSAKARFLHKLFAPGKALMGFEKEFGFFPSGLILLVFSFMSFILQPISLIIWSFIWYSATHTEFIFQFNTLLPFAFTLIISAISIYVALGSYWRFYEIVVNKKISVFLKLLVLGSVTTFLFYLTLGTRVWWSYMFSGLGPIEFKLFLLQISDNFGFYFIGFVLHTSPFIILMGIFFAKLIVSGIVFTGRLLQWLFRVQIPQSRKNLSKFLHTPLNLFNSNITEKFIELDKKYLSSIKAWVSTERQIIQSKLLPATLGIALLGAFASTSLGNDAIKFIKDVYLESASSPTITTSLGFWETILVLSKAPSFVKIVLISIIIGFFVFPISELLNRSVVLDFLAEACTLTEGIQSIQENERSSIDVKKSNWFIDFIVRLLGKS